jgi:hypothetical protein
MPTTRATGIRKIKELGFFLDGTLCVSGLGCGVILGSVMRGIIPDGEKGYVNLA